MLNIMLVLARFGASQVKDVSAFHLRSAWLTAASPEANAARGFDR